MTSFDLDYTLLSSTQNEWSWTIRHAVEGVQIFGGIGSGKTSGSGKTLAHKYLSANFGGLVLTVKPDEKDEWIKYCKTTNRENDLIIIEPNGKHRFNFLEFESQNTADKEALTENVVEVLKTVIRAGETAEKGKSDDAFWETALDMLIFHIIDLCKLADGKVSVEEMYKIVQTLPRPADSKTTADKNDKPRTEKAFYIAFEKARKKVSEIIDRVENERKEKTDDPDYVLSDVELDSIPEVRLFYFLDQFFGESFRSLSEKTRSIIEFTFSGFLFRLLREPIYSLFCNGASTVTPLDTLKGKIILINLPVKKYHKVGRDCQILFKYVWQRSMEQRKIDHTSRPVFLWADEAQNFLHEHDANYQATARSSRIATVYITQNLPNYYALMGGNKAEYRVKSFLGTLGTKIFHANADIETNNYASQLIGDIYNDVESKGTTTGNNNISQSSNIQKVLEKAIRPEEFVSLKTGSPKNDFKVGCVIHRQGDPFKDKNYLKMQFVQSK